MMRLAAMASIAIICGTPAYANLFQPNDARAIDEITSQLLNAQTDDVVILSSLSQAKLHDFADCVRAIDGELRRLNAELSSLSTLVEISSTMETIADENTVNSSIKIELQAAINNLSISRRYVNQTSVTCAASAIAISRAQMALKIFDDAQRALLLLRRRF